MSWGWGGKKGKTRAFASDSKQKYNNKHNER